eukprot:CFRG0080T1
MSSGGHQVLTLPIIARSAIHLGKKLGNGSFGTVFEATLGSGDEDTLRYQDVAVKCVHNRRDEQTALDEAQLHFEFDHVNIITVIGVCNTTDGIWIVTELAVFGSVYDALHYGDAFHSSSISCQLVEARYNNWTQDKSLPLPVTVVLDWALQIVNGMLYLHETLNPPVIHRDLKSANVLIASRSGSNHNSPRDNANGIVHDELVLKLCDFGTAREVDNNVYSKLQTFAGTLAWIAPEILCGDKRGYTLSADVYSFGIVLWELIMRAIPFEGISALTLARCVMEDKGRPPVPPQTPTSLANLMRACWNYKSEKRPTFRAIRQTLLQMSPGFEGKSVHGATQSEYLAFTLSRHFVKSYIKQENAKFSLPQSISTPDSGTISKEIEGKRQSELERWAIELSHRENNLNVKLRGLQQAHDADMSIAKKIRALAVSNVDNEYHPDAFDAAIQPFIARWSGPEPPPSSPVTFDMKTILKESECIRKGRAKTPDGNCVSLKTTGAETMQGQKRTSVCDSANFNSNITKATNKEVDVTGSEIVQVIQENMSVLGETATERSKQDIPELRTKTVTRVVPQEEEKAPDDDFSVDVTESSRLEGKGGKRKQIPPNFIFVGNTHRAISNPQLPHAWSVFVTDTPDELGHSPCVEAVEVKLHPTFCPSVIWLNGPTKISQERKSFMPFVVQFTIHFYPSVHLKHERVVVRHLLDLCDEGSIQIVNVPLLRRHRRKKVVSFNRRTFSSEMLSNEELWDSDGHESDQDRREGENVESDWMYVDKGLKCRNIQRSEK